jgi:hypothetical protein
VAPYHLLAYLAANLVTRKEIRNKQGQPLGDGSSILRPESNENDPVLTDHF